MHSRGDEGTQLIPSQHAFRGVGEAKMMAPPWSAASVAAALLAGALGSFPGDHRAAFQKPLPSKQERLEGPASVFANLSPADCRKQLRASEWAASFRFVGPRNGIANPVRIVAPLQGVVFRVPPERVSYGVLDCRQALLWIAIAPMMAEHGVEGVRIDNFYRNRARVRRGRKSQHAYALAADVVSVTFGEMRPGKPHETAADNLMGSGEADVEEDFLGRLGQPVCGPDARIVPRPESDAAQIARAVRLRNLVCAWGRMGAFHHILTPNYDQAHRNHLHLDLQRDNDWFTLR